MDKIADILEKFSKWLCVAVFAGISISLPLAESSFFDFKFRPLPIDNHAIPVEEAESYIIYPVPLIESAHFGNVPKRQKYLVGQNEPSAQGDPDSTNENEPTEVLNESPELPRPAAPPIAPSAPRNLTLMGVGS